jgi:hypothetical protein
MRKSGILLTTIASIACSGCALTGGGDTKPTITVVADTFCTRTTRYHATDGQKAAFKADRALWQPLVDWLASFNTERDKTCS